MIKMLSRAMFVLALVAVASTTFVVPAHAGTRLLEVRNKTENYILHFSYSVGVNGPKTEIAVLPGGSWGLDTPGTYVFDGSLQKAGMPTIKLQQNIILLKANQGVLMVLLAVYDNVGTKSYRWYVYIQK
jgi:hypothetical protein